MEHVGQGMSRSRGHEGLFINSWNRFWSLTVSQLIAMTMSGEDPLRLDDEGKKARLGQPGILGTSVQYVNLNEKC